METIRGKSSLELNFNGLTQKLAGYNHILLDLGTGDGRFVKYMAEQHPYWFVIGVDTCRENLREQSRAKLTNMLFIIASAQDLPDELSGLVSHVTINFPWGSLLESLLTADSGIMRGLASISQPVSTIDIRLNSGALAEAGTTLETGVDLIYSNMIQAGWQINAPTPIHAPALKTFPSTWAKRLAFGRDPRAMSLNGHFANQTQTMEGQVCPGQ